MRFSGAILALTLVAIVTAQAAAAKPAALPRSFVLGEGWRFQPDPNEIGLARGWQRPDFDRTGWRSVPVPAAWDSYDALMDGYEGIAWYALQLPTDRIVAAAWQRLRFGRVNHRATVWVDGVEVAQDSLGYVPFEAALTPHVHPGRPAWIVVRVENGTRYDWLPGTTTVEWVQYGGLLGPVELLTTARAYVDHVAIDARPTATGARVRAVVTVENSSDADFSGRVGVGSAGRTAEMPVTLAPGTTRDATLEFDVPEARAWTLESPVLHELEVRLLDGPRVVDAARERFGVRTIEARGRQIVLNGRALRVRGVNRYDEFPRRGPVASEAAIRADLLAIKAAGANLVRVHYPQSPVTLRIADEIGLLYMEEVPLNWWRASWHPPVPSEYENDRIIDSAEEALVRMIARDANHPSVIAWSVANECRTYDSLGVAAMERLIRRAHVLDPTRLVTFVANRSYEQNRAFRLADFVAVNLYYGMWEGEVAETAADMDSLVARPTSRALAEIAALYPTKPILLSEFGTIGLAGVGGDIRFSEDYQADYLASVWKAVRERPEVSGGVVWSWADYRHRRGFTNDYPAYFGPFGLVTLDRRPKKSLARLSEMWETDARVQKAIAAEGR